MNFKKTTLIVMIITFVHTSLSVIKYLSVVLNNEVQMKLFDFVSWTSSLLFTIGLCVFLFVFYKNMTSENEGLNEALGASPKIIKEKDGTQKNKWEFNWVGALVGMGVAGLFLGGVGGKYIIAGAISGGGGEFAVSVGLVIVIMVGIIVGYGVKRIKRK
jgi:hypothetical protein